MTRHELLEQLASPRDLQRMTVRDLEKLAQEMRDVLCNLVTVRSAHFASNLGVVELCLALHSVFDFSHDRLIWDTGHQIYPHKLVTGRYGSFPTIRTRGGLMGYPNPEESPYDLFMTGHAGSSVATMLGIRSGDELLNESDRHAVCVIGDGAFPSGIVFEAMNNLGAIKGPFLMILNDNCMSICPRVGNLASYLDRVRSTSFYSGFKTEMTRILTKVPMLGDPAERFLAQLKEAIKAGLHGGMLFEELGFRYIGPIDGHDLTLLRKYLRMVKKSPQPVLLHVITEKGHGFQPAAQDPVFFHTPPVLDKDEKKPKPSSAGRTYTHAARDAIQTAMAAHSDVTVLTAAMCQGNKLEPVREAFPDRFFDTGICESHTVAFAAGQAKAGLRPIVDIYSTFLQRSFDQIFQEVALQGLPVIFMLDRAGLTGPDGPTHHGVFDIAYQRIFPGMTVMAPGDARELSLMLEWALAQDGPVSIRYPKTTAFELPHEPAPVERGRSDTVLHGSDAVILAFGALLKPSYDAAERLRRDGFDVGLVNARFAKPLDAECLEQVAADARVVVTVEEGCLGGGFGSAVLEWWNERRLAPTELIRLGIPDRFVEHGDRDELLHELGLDAAGIERTVRSALVRREASP